MVPELKASLEHPNADRSLVLPVLKASLELPDADALWEKYIYKILDDLDIVYTTRERSIYRATIDGKVALLCRQVDNIAIGLLRFKCGALDPRKFLMDCLETFGTTQDADIIIITIFAGQGSRCRCGQRQHP
jgi:hypothetical protein